MRKIRSEIKVDELVDEIKDAIDQLHEIANPKRRLAAARDLIEYIQLHHVDYQDGGS